MGTGSTSSFGRVVICSHFSMQASSRPPSPRRSRTWVGASRIVVEHGITMRSFARSFLASTDRTMTGRRLSTRAQ